MQPPQAPPVQQQQRARNHAAESALDDIDHSNDEFLDDYFDEMVRDLALVGLDVLWVLAKHPFGCWLTHPACSAQ